MGSLLSELRWNLFVLAFLTIACSLIWTAVHRRRNNNWPFLISFVPWLETTEFSPEIGTFWDRGETKKNWPRFEIHSLFLNNTRGRECKNLEKVKVLRYFIIFRIWNSAILEKTKFWNFYLLIISIGHKGEFIIQCKLIFYPSFFDGICQLKNWIVLIDKWNTLVIHKRQKLMNQINRFHLNFKFLNRINFFMTRD